MFSQLQSPSPFSPKEEEREGNSFFNFLLFPPTGSWRRRRIVKKEGADKLLRLVRRRLREDDSAVMLWEGGGAKRTRNWENNNLWRENFPHPPWRRASCNSPPDDKISPFNKLRLVGEIWVKFFIACGESCPYVSAIYFSSSVGRNLLHNFLLSPSPLSVFLIPPHNHSF